MSRFRAVRRFATRRWLLAILAVALVVVASSQVASASALVTDLVRADWRWVAVAVVLHALFFALYGWLYEAAFRAVGVRSRPLRLVQVLFASIFAKTAVPITAAPAVAVFIDDATARGQSGPRTAVGLVLVLVIDLMTALPFVIAGTVALVAQDQLVQFALVGSGLFVGVIAGLIVLLVLAVLSPVLLRAFLARCAATVNRGARVVLRRDYLSDTWAARTTDQLVAAVRSIPGHPRDIAVAAGYGLVLHFANIAGLAALFLAFGQRLDPAALIAGFGMSIVFFIIAIVPDGIGAVEGAMALTFVHLGMDAPAAIIVTAAYRILNVWLPVAIGFVCARRLRVFGGFEADRRLAASAAARSQVIVEASEP